MSIKQELYVNSSIEPVHIPMEDITCSKTILGSGGQGDVFLGTFQHQKVAIKKLKKGEKDQIESLLKEVSVMHEMIHPRMLQCFGYADDDEYIYIVTEAMEGNLSDLLYGPGKRDLTADQKFRLAMQIAEGLVVAKQRNVIHRDIKSANILYDKSLNVKIADFGISRVKSQLGSDNTVTIQKAGTLKWIAPEILVAGQFGFASDVYSFGVLLYEIVEEKTPYSDFDKLSAFEFMKQIVEGRRPWIQTVHNPLLKKLRTIQESCLVATPSSRMTIEAIHDILVNFYDLKEKLFDEIVLKKYLAKQEYKRGSVWKAIGKCIKVTCTMGCARSSIQIINLVLIIVTLLLSFFGAVYAWGGGDKRYVPDPQIKTITIITFVAAPILLIFFLISLCFNLLFRRKADHSLIESFLNCCSKEKKD